MLAARWACKIISKHFTHAGFTKKIDITKVFRYIRFHEVDKVLMHKVTISQMPEFPFQNFFNVGFNVICKCEILDHDIISSSMNEKITNNPFASSFSRY